MAVDNSAAHTIEGCTCGSTDCPCPASRPRTTWKGPPGEVACAAVAVERAGVPVWDGRHVALVMERLSYRGRVHVLRTRRPADTNTQIERLTASLTTVRRGHKLGLTDGHTVWWPNARTTDEPTLRFAFANHRGTWED